jgi:hypothetical protein
LLCSQGNYEFGQGAFGPVRGLRPATTPGTGVGVGIGAGLGEGAERKSSASATLSHSRIEDTCALGAKPRTGATTRACPVFGFTPATSGAGVGGGAGGGVAAGAGDGAYMPN